MPFNPDDLLTLVKEIKNFSTENSEALRRTIISRCYYSSFLMSRDFAITHGEYDLRKYNNRDYPKPGEVHSAVRNSLTSLELGFIGGKLLSLFENRVDADYYLNITINDEYVEESIALSESIKGDIANYS